MPTVEKDIVVDRPVHEVYNQWTQFESFPRFMDGVEEVRQLDDTHLHWKARIAGREKEWNAEITEQVPDQVISWRSTDGAPNAGTVRFQPTEGGTRVELRMEHQPEGVIETVGDAVGVFGHQVKGDLERFKQFIEERGVATGEWRGTVQGGDVRSTPQSTTGAGSTGTTGGGTVSS